MDIVTYAAAVNASKSAASQAASQAVSEVTTYSTTEQVVGTWIDGRSIYRKVIDFGKGPAWGYTKSVDPEIADFDRAVNIYGVVWESNGYCDPIFEVSMARAWMKGNDLTIEAQADLTDRDIYVIVEYIKTLS